MQSDEDLHSSLTELLDTTECINGEQRLGRKFARGQDDLNLRILCMFDVAQLVLVYHVQTA